MRKVVILAVTRALTQAEIDYIIEAREKGLPNKTIAKNLDRSVRCIQKYAAKYTKKRVEVAKLSQKLPDVDEPTTFDEVNGQDTLSRLRETRDLLRTQMLVAESRNIAQIAKEYRSTLEQIKELEGAMIRENGKAAESDPIVDALRDV